MKTPEEILVEKYNELYAATKPGSLFPQMPEPWMVEAMQKYSNQQNKELSEALTSLKIFHYVNDEDCWYSCPESGECCDSSKSGCNCGANDHNKRIDDLILKLKPI